MLKKTLIGLVILVAAFLGIGLLLPAQFKISRSAVIAAPAEKIYPHFATPKAWKDWSVWTRRDPAMQITYSGAEAGQGAAWSWISKSEGNGTMTLTAVEPNKNISYKLEFPDMQMTSTGAITLAPEGAGTKVTWTNEGDLGGNPVSRWFGLVMDSMVGKDFEAGLNNLKGIVEKQ